MTRDPAAAKDEDVVGVLSTNYKMPCGCRGELRQGNERLTWLVTASSFLCKHKQGDVVVVGEANDNAA